MRYRLMAVVLLLVLVALGVGARADARGRAASDSGVSMGASLGGVPLGFGPVAIDGGTVVAVSDEPSVPPPGPATGASVFSTGSAGWRDGRYVAQLVPSDGAQLGDVAIQGGLVAASRYGGAETGAAYVFVRPRGGWSGSTPESAVLRPSSGSFGLTAGPVAVAGGSVFAAGGGRVYVFDRPASGWTGSLTESAQLVASDGSSLSAFAASGRTVVAYGTSGTSSAVYVFSEPASGWSGVIHEVARLLPADRSEIGGDFGFGQSLWISGRSVAVASADFSSGAGASNGIDLVYVFFEPAGGWRSTRPTAEYSYPIETYDTLPEEVVISGGLVATLSNVPMEHECPCTGDIYAAEVPPSGVHPLASIGQVASALTSGSRRDIAFQAPALAVATPNSVEVLTIPPPPRIVHATLRRLSDRHPALTVQVESGADYVTLDAISIRLPAGLRFAARYRDLAHDVTVNGTPSRAVRSGAQALNVTVHNPSGELTLTVKHPAIMESAGLASRIRTLQRYNQSHRPKRSLRLVIITIRVTDGAGRQSTLTQTLTPQ